MSYMFGSDGGRPSSPPPPQWNAPPLSQSSTPTTSSQADVYARNWGNNAWNCEGSNAYWPLSSQQQMQMAYPHHHLTRSSNQYHRHMAMAPPLPPYAHPYPGFGQPFLGFESSSTYTYVSTLPPASWFDSVPAPAPPLLPSKDLRSRIVKQIDYYFSDDNLAKDPFLRSNMDDKGWVTVTLIASFKRVNQLTKDIEVILESMRYSNVVEVQQSGKLRRRNGWKKWLLLP